MDGFDSELEEDVGFIRYIVDENSSESPTLTDEYTEDVHGTPSVENNEGERGIKGGEQVGGEAGKDDPVRNGINEGESDPETDLEDDVDEISRAPNTARMIRLEDVYLRSCKELKITPCSPFLRQIRDEEIDISHYNVGPIGVKALAKTLKINTTTTLLNVHDNGIDIDGAKALADMLKENCFITVLDLSMNFVKEEGLAAVCKMLGMNKYLLELSLASTRFSDASADNIADAMTKNSTLRSLNLSSNEVSTEGGIHLARGIESNTGITFLDLSSNHIRGKGATAIAESLSNNYTLKTLDISANGFSDYGTRAVGRALKTNTTLREIDISQNRISPDGAWALGIGLEENIGLKVLKVGGNPFQSRGATSIIDSLITNKESTIEEIYLDDIIVSRDFEKLLPELLEQRQGLHVQFGVVVRGKEHRRRGKEKKDLVSRILDYIELRGIRVVDFFRAMDKTGRLSITKEELIKGLKTAGIPMRMSQLENLFELLDLDGNGFAQYKEFVDIIRRRTHEEFATLRNNYQWNH